MHVSHDHQDTHILQILTRLLELQNMKSSTVVLPNSGHDHHRNFASRSPNAVAASASVIRVLLASKGCISGGLRGFLPKNISFFCKCLNSVGSGIKDIGSRTGRHPSQIVIRVDSTA